MRNCATPSDFPKLRFPFLWWGKKFGLSDAQHNLHQCAIYTSRSEERGEFGAHLRDNDSSKLLAMDRNLCATTTLFGCLFPAQAHRRDCLAMPIHLRIGIALKARRGSCLQDHVCAQARKSTGPKSRGTKKPLASPNSAAGHHLRSSLQQTMQPTSRITLECHKSLLVQTSGAKLEWRPELPRAFIEMRR